jgi:multidrug efflux system membrane fusion protein
MKRVTLWLVGISLVLLAAGGAYELLRAQRGATGSSANTGAPPARPLPVTAAIVAMKDFPIYRIGLGTAQAYNTVTVKVRVDGEIQKRAQQGAAGIGPGRATMSDPKASRRVPTA